MESLHRFYMDYKCLYTLRNIQKSLVEHWGGGLCFSPFLNPVKSLNAALLQSKFDCIHLNNHSNWHILYKATKNYRCNFLIRDQSTCKGMKSGIKLPSLSGPKYCLPCWQEKNRLVVDLSCQKAREWNRDHSAVMKQRGPCAHTQCDNVCFEYVSMTGNIITTGSFKCFLKLGIYSKTKVCCGNCYTTPAEGRTKTCCSERSALLRLKTKLLTLGQRANDLCYRESGLLQQDRAI